MEVNYNHYKFKNWVLGNLNTSPDAKPSKHSNKIALSADKSNSSGVHKDKWFPYQIYHQEEQPNILIKIKTKENNYSQKGLLGRWKPTRDIILLLDNSVLECQLWLECVDIAWLVPLSWVHAFHSLWLEQYVESLIDDKRVPIQWPVCRKELLDREIRVICSPPKYDEYINIHYKTLLLEENSKNLIWPTINCNSKIDADFSKKPLKYHCPNWKKSYCPHWRDTWHHGLSWNEYRVRKGYPVDDVLLLKIFKNDLPKCWDGSSSLIEKSNYWNDKAGWNNELNSHQVKYNAKTAKQPVHSFSAKPAYNSKYYKFVSVCFNK